MSELAKNTNYLKKKFKFVAGNYIADLRNTKETNEP